MKKARGIHKAGDTANAPAAAPENSGGAAAEKTYRIEVDCAACANKMEQAARRTAGVKDASVNFMALRMRVVFDEGCDPHAVMRAVRDACKRVERDCEIYL